MGGRAQRRCEREVRELTEATNFPDPEPTIYRDISAFVVGERGLYPAVPQPLARPGS